MTIPPTAEKLDARIPGVVISNQEAAMTQRNESYSERNHIESVPGRCGGKPCIVGHRIRVQDIVLWTEQGMTPDDIANAYPQLTLADVHAALAYYFDNIDEINRDVREDEELVARIKSAQGPNLLGEVK